MSALESIRDAGIHIFVAATGAGAGIQQDLWSTPGISKVLVGAQFPYAGKETDEFLGFHPAKYVSEDTAIEMASAAYIRAKAVAGIHGKAVGLGLTASTSTNYDKRSPNEVYAVVVGDTGCWVVGKPLNPMALDNRFHQGVECDLVGLGLLQYATTGQDSVSFIRSVTKVDCTSRVEELFWNHPVFMPTGQRLFNLLTPHTLFPGSFNPPHEGHHHMATQAEEWNLKSVAYEINVDSPHKGRLTGVEMLARAAYFRVDRHLAPRPLRFTYGMPLFTDKVNQRPWGTCFVMGADTLERILDPKWGPSTKAVLETFYNTGTHVYLFDREVRESDGSVRFIDAQRLVGDLHQYQDVFNYLGSSKSISSTDIRNAK